MGCIRGACTRRDHTPLQDRISWTADAVSACTKRDWDGIPIEVIEFKHHVRQRDTAAPRALTAAQEAIGKAHSIEHTQLAICFGDQILGLPDFNLTPIGDIDHLFQRYVPQDRVLWNQDAQGLQFCKMYYLCAIRKDLLKPSFGLRTIQYLVENPGWNIQSREGRLMLWRVKPPTQRFDEMSPSAAPLNPKTLPETIMQTLQIRRMLAREV